MWKARRARAEMGRAPSAVQAALVAVLCIVVCCGVSCRGDAGGAGCNDGAAYDDVVLAPGLDVCSSADAEQRDLIERLAEAAAGEDALATLTVDYPLEGSIFPPEIEAPTFLWHDDAAASEGWLVDVSLDGGSSRLYVLADAGAPPEGEIDPRCIAVTNEIYRPTAYQASARAWKPGPEVWDAIKRHSRDRPAVATFLGYRGGEAPQVLSRGRVVFETSSDPVGAPVFYRDVPLMPTATAEGVIKPLDQKAQPLIAWRLRDVSLPESRVLLRDMPTCANCHSFSADGKTLGMDIDGPTGDKGAYGIATVMREMVIRNENVMTWNDFPGKPEGRNSLGFLARVSPDGRHVVATVNEALYVVNFTDHRFSQVFYPTRGILAVYSRETGKIEALPGADDPEFVHCDPVWTPDGQTLVFARARAREPYIEGRPLPKYAGDPNETPIQYDLYRIPFRDGRGGTPERIVGASDNGMSNTFPKVSPDGRWIVFVQCKNGQLMRPDSKLWIVPVEGGEARPLQSNLPLMNSWHSFSPNGRWMVFSSKSNTPYTQMFLTHLDEQGNASPAVLIENSTAANRAVNLPEFVNAPYERLVSITVPAVDHRHFFRRGAELAEAGRDEAAVAEFEKALRGESTEWRLTEWMIHDGLSKSLLKLGQTERAVEHIRISLELNPNNAEMHGNLGYVLFEQGDLERSLEHFDFALRIEPREAQHWYNRGSVRLKAGRHDGALRDYTEAIRLDNEYADAYAGRGLVLGARGDLEAAVADFDRAIELDPGNPSSRYFRAVIRKDGGDLPGAAADLDALLRTAPRDWPRRPEVEALRRTVAALLQETS